MKKLPKSTVLLYGLTALPLAMLGLPLYIYLPTFYAQEMGMGVSMVGAILFLARTTDVISDPLIGLWNDRYKRAYGSRKVFMLIGALVLIVGFYALIHPPAEGTALWLLALSILVYLGWSLVSIPYLAWSSEITPDYHDKTLLSASRESFTIIGAMSALTIPYLLSVASEPSKSLESLYFAFLMTLLIALPLTLRYVKEARMNASRPLSTRQIWEVWKAIPGVRRLQAAFVFNALANALPATLFLFFVELVIMRPDQTGQLLLLYFASGIIGLPLWTLLAKRTSKRFSWQTSMLLASVAFVFVLFLGPGDIEAFYLITAISGLSLGADMALPASIQADIAQRSDERGDALSGVLFGVWAMLTKLSLALAVGLGFLLLGAVGFEPASPTPLALTTLTMLYGGAPVLFKSIAFFIIKAYRERES